VNFSVQCIGAELLMYRSPLCQNIGVGKFALELVFLRYSMCWAEGVLAHQGLASVVGGRDSVVRACSSECGTEGSGNITAVADLRRLHALPTVGQVQYVGWWRHNVTDVGIRVGRPSG
jgi:hypothetical protein